MVVMALPLLLCEAVAGSLTLERYANTALAGSGAQRSLLDTLSVSLPGALPFSAEASGSFSPRVASNATWWSFTCTFRNIDYAFVRIDGHMVCQHGAYNNTGPGGLALDPGQFRLRTKQSKLPLLASFYHTHITVEPAVVELRWCEEGNSTRCVLLPSSTLSPVLPGPAQRQRAMQRGMANGWGSWLHRDALSIALLPDSAVLTVMLCRISTGECLRQSNIDGNGGGIDLTHPVRVGSHSIDHSYSQLYAWGPSESQQHVNVSIEYSVGKRDKSGSERELDVLVTPVAVVGANESDSEDKSMANFAVVFAGTFAWGRVGTVSLGVNEISLQALGLEPVQLRATANVLPNPIPGAVPPGLLGGQACQFGSKACGSQSCTQNAGGDIACSSGVCLTPPGTPWAVGNCTTPKQLQHLALSLGAGPVGLTTRSSTNASETLLKSIQARVLAAATVQRQHEQRFGTKYAELAQALEAAISWRNIYVPAESGPVMPTTYGFSWIDVGPKTNDWRYIQFGWDDIFASYIAGVLGYRQAAYSNLIGIVAAKSNDGYVPNHADGGSISSRSEPPIGGKVLLELFQRFGDVWIVELLLDHLVDWSDWQWERRRVVGVGACADPGFITIGNDYVNCSTNPSTASNCPGGGESGLDQSPKWDCPGAAPDGSGGNCSVFVYRNPQSSPHVLQLADMQSTSLFVLDAESIAVLAVAINRTEVVPRLRSRAAQMKAQLAKAWDNQTRFFADIYPATGEFSDKLTPTAFYPLFAGAATDQQAITMVQDHLLNASEFCISADYASHFDSKCYWGLPSISANAASFMQPLRYIYWRGLSWGPMTMMTWWALDAYSSVPQVKAARTLLATQKTDMMISMWRAHRHICENYSPYAPGSKRNAGTSNGGQRNNECTGWQFYHWGALNGLTSLLEAGV